jgi:hypothetical protein
MRAADVKLEMFKLDSCRNNRKRMVSNCNLSSSRRFVEPGRQSRRVAELIVFLVIAHFEGAIATEYSVVPRARVTMRAEDNIRGAQDNGEGAIGFDSGGGLDLFAKSETVTSQLSPHANFRRFFVGDDIDADEYGVVFNSDWTGEHIGASVDFSYARDSTLTSEATDAGLINTVAARDNVSLKPNFVYRLTEALSSQTTFLYQSVSYNTSNLSEFVDYEYKQFSTGLNYDVARNWLLFANVNVSQFDTSQIKSGTRNYSGQLGITWHWSPTFETTGAVGWNHSAVHFFEVRNIFVPSPTPRLISVEVPADSTSSGPIAMASIQKAFENYVYKLDYSRQVSPSGRGSQTEADHIVGTIKRRVTARFQVELEGIYDMQSAGSLGPSGTQLSGILNRDYLSASLNARYALTPEWALTGIYRYTKRESNSELFTISAEGNALYFVVEFNGEPIVY